jgi:virginiamycin B lyase
MIRIGQAQTIQEFPTPTISSSPGGITVGPDGAVWFTEFNTIGRVTSAGIITEYPLPLSLAILGLSGIVAGSDGALWFTSSNNKIGRITTAGSVTSFAISTPTAQPKDIAAGPDGALWFTESGSGKIGRITTSGAVTEFPTLVNGSSPFSITAGPDGAMWFTELSLNVRAIGRITTAGAITEFPVPNSPGTITSGPDGALWFTENGNLIGRITTSGQVSHFPLPSTSSGEGIALGPDGALWFADIGTNSVGRITTAGRVTEVPIPTSNSLFTPLDSLIAQLTAGPDGAIWFTETRASQIGRLSIGPGSGTSPLVAAVLPSSRSVQVGGTPATAFATIINSGSSAVSGCAIAPVTSVPASFVYQTTDPATNALTGSPNTPAPIAGNNGSQTFVIALTPNAPVVPTEVALGFSCASVNAAPSTTGLNTLLYSASSTPVPDVVALAATAQNDGILHITGTSGSNAFAVATVNVGASAQITATANTGSQSLPLSINLCQTDPHSGQCSSAVGPSVTFTISANATPTVAIFATASGAVPFDPANNRIFVTFSDAGGVVRGSTSVAVQTQ